MDMQDAVVQAGKNMAADLVDGTCLRGAKYNDMVSLVKRLLVVRLLEDQPCNPGIGLMIQAGARVQLKDEIEELLSQLSMSLITAQVAMEPSPGPSEPEVLIEACDRDPSEIMAEHNEFHQMLEDSLKTKEEEKLTQD